MSGRVLVTGGAGFIGSHVADQFIANGFDAGAEGGHLSRDRYHR
jgi:nucleoside-diphosphate-sugar epimerase